MEVKPLKIAIIPNLEKENVISCTNEVCKFINSHGGEVLMDIKYKDMFSTAQNNFDVLDKVLEKCDLVIAIGGDGTLIHCAIRAVEHFKPILGINLGRLGFLSSIEANEINQLEKVFNGQYYIEECILLNVVVETKTEKKCFSAFNDAVITRGCLSKIIDFDVSLNDKLIGKYRADGVIFSTPAGSTAYALSAGGPVIDPKVSTISMTPICPHSLFSRTIVFASDKTIEISNITGRETNIYLTIDGSEHIEISDTDKVYVSKLEKSVKLITFTPDKFFKVLKEKFLK